MSFLGILLFYKGTNCWMEKQKALLFIVSHCVWVPACLPSSLWRMEHIASQGKAEAMGLEGEKTWQYAMRGYQELRESSRLSCYTITMTHCLYIPCFPLPLLQKYSKISCRTTLSLQCILILWLWNAPIISQPWTIALPQRCCWLEAARPEVYSCRGSSLKMEHEVNMVHTSHQNGISFQHESHGTG